MKFRTENGSVYETDPDLPRIRRLSGDKAPTPRQGPDGKWKDYEYLTAVAIGQPVIIGWRIDISAEAALVRATMTSPVSEILSG